MIIQHLKIKNWKHFDIEKEINFEPGVNIISGPNFAGKSSILEALQYALSGQFPDIKSKLVNKKWISKDKNFSEIELKFRNNNKEYIVKRTIKPRKGRKDITEELFEFEAGKEISICSGEKVNEFLHDILPWTKHTLNKILFLTDEVVNEISSGQKDLFNSLKDLLSFEEVKSYLGTLKNEIKEYESTAKLIESKLKEFKLSNTDLDAKKLEIEKEIMDQKKIVNDKQIEYDKLSADKRKIIDLKEKQIKIKKINEESAIILKELKVNEWKEADLKIESLEKSINTLRGQKLEITGKIGEIRGKKGASEDILKILIQSSSADCPVCKKILSSDEKSLLESEINNNIKLFNSEMDQIQSKVKKLENDLNTSLTMEKQFKKRRTDYIAKSKLLVDLLKGYDEKIDYSKEYQKNKEDLKKAKELLEAQTKILNNFMAELLKIEQEIAFHKEDLPKKLKETWIKFHKANITKEALDKTENEFILNMLKSIEQEIIQQWSEFQSTPIEVSLGTQKGIDIKMKRENKEFEIYELSGSEKRIFILIISLLLNKKFFNYSFQTIDEPFEPLDNDNIRKLEEFLIKISEQRQIICTAVGSFTGAKINVIDLN